MDWSSSESLEQADFPVRHPRRDDRLARLFVVPNRYLAKEWGS
jgi:hypothetical protein